MDACLRSIADHLLAQNGASTVDPSVLDPKALPHFYILDVERGPSIRLRIRLVGTALDELFQRPVVGHVLEEFIHGPRGRDVITSFHDCARLRQPLWMRQVVNLPGRVPRVVEGVAVYLEPNRIYGGLTAGDVSLPGAETSFERRVLSRVSR